MKLYESGIDDRCFFLNEDRHTHRPIGWERMGYAWYVATCLDPYNELRTTNVLTQDEPYNSACIDKGINPDNMSVTDYRIMYDAISYVALKKA